MRPPSPPMPLPSHHRSRSRYELHIKLGIELKSTEIMFLFNRSPGRRRHSPKRNNRSPRRSYSRDRNASYHYHQSSSHSRVSNPKNIQFNHHIKELRTESMSKSIV